MSVRLSARDVLDHLTCELNDHLADLWVLRDAIDAELTGARHGAAVAQISQLAVGLAEAADRVGAMAQVIGPPVSSDGSGEPK